MITEAHLLSCATCANNFIHGETDAAGWSIALMLFIIVPMATMVLLFMIRMARRESATLDPQYNDDYIPPTT